MKYVVCERVASSVSYYRAAEGDSWNKEREARERAESAWRRCRLWLYGRGELRDFIQRGGYLMFTQSEMDGAERDYNAAQSGGTEARG